MMYRGSIAPSMAWSFGSNVAVGAAAAQLGREFGDLTQRDDTAFAVRGDDKAAAVVTDDLAQDDLARLKPCLEREPELVWIRGRHGRQQS